MPSNLIFYLPLTRRFYSNGRVALPVGDYAIQPLKALRMAYKGFLDLLTPRGFCVSHLQRVFLGVPNLSTYLGSPNSLLSLY